MALLPLWDHCRFVVGAAKQSGVEVVVATDLFARLAILDRLHGRKKRWADDRLVHPRVAHAAASDFQDAAVKGIRENGGNAGQRQWSSRRGQKPAPCNFNPEGL